MKIRLFLYIVWGMFPGLSHAQLQLYKTYDYSKIGLQFRIPSAWTEDGLATTTKAAFIKQFGWVYDKPDADDIWNAVGSFYNIEIDSTLLPSDSAYTIHRLTIFVNRANTLYKQWLCRHYRNTLMQAKPLAKQGDQLIRNDNIWPYALPQGLSTAKGISYEYLSQESILPTLGHVFSFVHEARCFEFKVETTAPHLQASQQLHQEILNSVILKPF